MLPLLPFIAGIATGAVAIKLWRNDKTTQTLENAKVKIREATVSGLSRLESSTAAMRDKLAVPETETAAVETAVAAKTTRSRKPAAKPATKPATQSAAEPAKKPAAKRASKPKAAKPQTPAGDGA